MLRPANDALKDHKFESATAIALLAFSLLIPCLVALSAAFFADVAHRYLSEYRPIVYLSAEAGESQATQLAGELGEWASVGEAKVRSPEAAFELLQTRLGEQEVARLGMTSTMLPYSVELVPTVPLMGHVDLIARVAGLPVRPEVATVDVPSAEAARTLIAARWLVILGGVLLLAMLLGGVAQTRIFLGRLAQLEARETFLLTLFGASPARLRRATLARGVTVGVLAGIAGFVGLLLAIFMWQYARPALFGLQNANLGWAWLILIGPLVIGPAAGFFAAGLTNRAQLKRNDTDALELQILV